MSVYICGIPRVTLVDEKSVDGNKKTRSVTDRTQQIDFIFSAHVAMRAACSPELQKPKIIRFNTTDNTVGCLPSRRRQH